MTNLAKLLVGASCTSLLAWGAHAVTGERFVSGLGESSALALSEAGIAGVLVDDPAQYSPISRTMVLSGEGLTAEQRAAAEKAVLAVSGVAAVRWADEKTDLANAGAAAGDATQSDPETAAAVTKCQTGIDAAIAEKSITFRSGSTFMPDSSLAVVTEVADALKGCDGLKVAVSGHTDSTGSAEVNQNLSQGRADAVAAALTERGIAASRIIATGFGSTKPKVPGDGANAANRRIEFTVSGATASADAEGGE